MDNDHVKLTAAKTVRCPNCWSYTSALILDYDRVYCESCGGEDPLALSRMNPKGGE